jgi:predicted transcriptional regulator of viral defense system
VKQKTQNIALQLVDDMVADGLTHFTFDEARRRLGRSHTATANLLRRMVAHGLVDRIRRGHYAIRRLGVLGTRAAAEDLAIVVAAAFSGQPHRIAYRTALDELDLIAHPVRTIYVASTRRMRVKNLSGWPLQTVSEPEEFIRIGAVAHGPSWISGFERALLDAAARPDLSGGAAVLAGAIAAAVSKINPDDLTSYAKSLGWGAALRRIGSVADALGVGDLAGRIAPLKPPVADLDLEPGSGMSTVWRDSRWRVRWAQLPDELANVIRQ